MYSPDRTSEVSEKKSVSNEFHTGKDEAMALKHAVLFKSTVGDGESERYGRLNTQEFGLAVNVVHVMDFEYLNENILLEALQNPYAYRGLILTSSRAVSAIERLFENSEDRWKCMSEWKKKSSYSVGKETSSLAEACLGLQTTGQHTGNSENLVKFILSDSLKSTCLPFLFPCSRMRKNTLIEGLSNSGIPVKEIIAYVPVPRSFNDDWHCLLKSIKEIGILQGTGKSEPDILIFFSPSVVKIVLDGLSCQGFELSKYKVVAFGPSTAKELLSLGISANVCDEPSPQGIENLLKTLCISRTDHL